MSAETTESAAGTVATSSRQAGGVLASKGRTSIADAVVQKIASIAAREVSGVHALGGSATRAMVAIRERIPGASQSHGQGVGVEVGERQTAIDLDMVVEYGVAIPDLSNSVRRNVTSTVERMTGLEVTEVNVAVNDVYVPSEDAEEPRSRVE
jgi:uncharacterized alkaline shock family protein YloU